VRTSSTASMVSTSAVKALDAEPLSAAAHTSPWPKGRRKRRLRDKRLNGRRKR
jgi:hypothetical protein